MCNLFPQSARRGPTRVKHAFEATSDQIGEVAGIEYRRYALQSSTTCLSFIGNSQLAQLVVVFGEDLFWNIRQANQRSLGMTVNETVLLMKDASSERQSSVSFERRLPHGPSFLGIDLYIKIKANSIVVPVNVPAHRVSCILDPQQTTPDPESIAGDTSDEDDQASAENTPTGDAGDEDNRPSSPFREPIARGSNSPYY
jgi:hypothetical protein